MIRKLFPRQRITMAHAFFLGAVLALAALSPAIFPYGGRFVTRGDFIEQQLPFILETKRVLEGGLNGYSFSNFLGAPAVGSYAFYTLGSVFVWPLALLPNVLIPFGISVMAVLKHAVGVMCAYCYFRRVLKEEKLALLGGAMYMFSSFTVVNTQFYHFTEVIAFFPLILLGLEMAMSDTPRPGLLAIFCGINALTNYYFMLSSALLAALYFMFRFFSGDWRPYRSLRRVITVVFECGIGCALSGVILLPALHYMLSITRTGEGISVLVGSGYSLALLLERIRSLLMPIESGVVHAFYGQAPSWSSTAACLPVFGMAGVGVFLFAKGERWLKALLSALLVCSAVPALCGAFALFTNITYTRWWYGLCAMTTLATLYALKQFPLSRRAWIISAAVCTGAAVLLILPGLLPEALLAAIAPDMVPVTHSGAYSGDAFRLLALALTFLSVGALLMIILKRPRFTAMLALVCSVACIQYAGYIAIGDRYLLSGGSDAGNGVYELDSIAQPTLGTLELDEPQEYYRIDYGKKLRNYGLLRGQPSLTCFSSLRTSTIGRFVTLAGFGNNESTTILPPDDSPALRALLSVKEYHQLDGEPVPEGFVYHREENGFSVYENENYLPMGFLQTTYTGTYDQKMAPDTVAQVLLAAAAIYPEDINQYRSRMTQLDPLNIPDCQESVARLRENACDRFETTANGFSAHIDAKEAGLVIFTIPHDKGFSATVDGQTAPILLCDVSFMGVWVEPGEHEIVFTFHTRSLNLGIGMSLLAAAVLSTYVVLCRKKSGWFFPAV